MEIILAIVVASAVIFFGALISMGNERQRKAIDGLREQVVLWAVQDLKIKREHLKHAVEVPDPLSWLNRVASRVCGYDLKLQMFDTFDNPQTLVCASGENSINIIFSPFSPVELRRIKRQKRNRLTQFPGHHPLLTLPNSVEVYDLSILNEGYWFDLELALVWKALTGQNFELSNQLWMYKLL